ncbi:unnamed protein product [Diplocarpon coronariae]
MLASVAISPRKLWYQPPTCRRGLWCGCERASGRDPDGRLFFATQEKALLALSLSLSLSASVMLRAKSDEYLVHGLIGGGRSSGRPSRQHRACVRWSERGRGSARLLFTRDATAGVSATGASGREGSLGRRCHDAMRAADGRDLTRRDGWFGPLKPGPGTRENLDTQLSCSKHNTGRREECAAHHRLARASARCSSTAPRLSPVPSPVSYARQVKVWDVSSRLVSSGVQLDGRERAPRSALPWYLIALQRVRRPPRLVASLGQVSHDEQKLPALRGVPVPDVPALSRPAPRPGRASRRDEGRCTPQPTSRSSGSACVAGSGAEDAAPDPDPDRDGRVWDFRFRPRDRPSGRASRAVSGGWRRASVGRREARGPRAGVEGVPGAMPVEGGGGAETAPTDEVADDVDSLTRRASRTRLAVWPPALCPLPPGRAARHAQARRCAPVDRTQDGHRIQARTSLAPSHHLSSPPSSQGTPGRAAKLPSPSTSWAAVAISSAELTTHPQRHNRDPPPKKGTADAGENHQTTNRINPATPAARTWLWSGWRRRLAAAAGGGGPALVPALAGGRGRHASKGSGAQGLCALGSMVRVLSEEFADAAVRECVTVTDCSCTTQRQTRASRPPAETTPPTGADQPGPVSGSGAPSKLSGPGPVLPARQHGGWARARARARPLSSPDGAARESHVQSKRAHWPRGFGAEGGRDPCAACQPGTGPRWDESELSEKAGAARSCNTGPPRARHLREGERERARESYIRPENPVDAAFPSSPDLPPLSP